MGLGIQSLIQSLRINNPQVGDAFSQVQSAINDIYTALTQGQQIEDLIITDPTGRKIIELSGLGQITVQDASGQQVAMLGDVVETPLTITAATNASPVVVTISGHPYVNGDTIFVQGATGNTAINGYRIVQGVTTNTFTMTNLAGTVINGNGTYAGTATATRYYGGLLTQTVAIGPSFANYKLRAFADGSLRIKDAQISVTGTNWKIDINATTGGISLTSIAHPLQIMQIQSDALILTDNAGHGVGYFQADAASAFLVVSDDAAANSVTLDGSTGDVSATGDIGATGAVSGNTVSATTSISAGTVINAASGFKYNGTPGTTTNVMEVTSLNVATIANGLRGTPGAGQSNVTLVTGVTLNYNVHQVLGGILTT